VIGELAIGYLPPRAEILALLGGLPQAAVATDAEVLTLIDRHSLDGQGVGYVDAQLLASTLLTPDSRLWTRDKRLAAVASELGCAASADS
jgi:hypothetical protein